ncbi:hypothetical protein Y032_0398g714 [Ancylostoma ceylanicum]|nr:hypothetical protein Y032_0398g714 [Ancylostoma ceylanicum]
MALTMCFYSFLLIIVIIAIVLVVACCIALPIAYSIKEKRRKQYLAETWDQRVKEAGEQISKTESASGAHASTSKEKKRKK